MAFCLYMTALRLISPVIASILSLGEPVSAYLLSVLVMGLDVGLIEGIGVVMVLHDLSHALEVSDWIVVIKDGEKYDEGKPCDVITPKMMREVYDVECDIVHLPGREKPVIAYREIC